MDNDTQDVKPNDATKRRKRKAEELEAYFLANFPTVPWHELGTVFHVSDKGFLTLASHHALAACLGRAGRPDRPVVFCAETGEYLAYCPETGLYSAKEKQEVTVEILKLLTGCASARNAQAELSGLQQAQHVEKGAIALQGVSTMRLAEFELPRHLLHVRNGILDLRSLELLPFSPNRPSREAVPAAWEPTAPDPVEFLTFLAELFPRPDDRALALVVMALCLVGNPPHKIAIVSGPGGSGKSTWVKLLEAFVGAEAAGQLRLEHAGSRFESSDWRFKRLVTQLEATPETLMKNAPALKALSGQDTFSGEEKSVQKRTRFRPRAMIVITSNPRLRVRIEEDRDSWKRRLLLLHAAARPAGRVEIDDYADRLMAAEADGILRVVATVARDLIASRYQVVLSPKQQARVDRFLDESDPLSMFVSDCLEPRPGVNAYTAHVYAAADRYLSDNGYAAIPRKTMATKIRAIIKERLGIGRSGGLPPRQGISTKGWYNLRLRSAEEIADV